MLNSTKKYQKEQRRKIKEEKLRLELLEKNYLTPEEVMFMLKTVS